jgi:hypothetical protein
VIVPYKSTPDLLVALRSGIVDAAFEWVPGILPPDPEHGDQDDGYCLADPLLGLPTADHQGGRPARYQ